ncbi:MAG: thiamine-phosphate kinase, partial [Gammaproteobacteria bacterium]|nr:thiamine-phosphate kinase [Gammaproteobacteria bacterium]
MGLSEFDIIGRYFSHLWSGDSPGILLGPGDDCAIIRPPPGQDLCVSTDTLVEGVHFPLGASPAVIAGRSLAVNLSDLAAMGARPLGLTMALTLSEANEDWLRTFSDVLGQMTQQYACPLIGGNLARGPLSVTVQVMGTCPAGQAICRSGASAGDLIYVSGSLGDAAMALHLMNRGEVVPPILLARYENPSPRLALGEALQGIASSAIDVSDGLLADLGHILDRSGVGALLETDSLPLSEALLEVTDSAQALALALSGGDDYELCFTVPPEKQSRLSSVR